MVSLPFLSISNTSSFYSIYCFFFELYYFSSLNFKTVQTFSCYLNKTHIFIFGHFYAGRPHPRFTSIVKLLPMLRDSTLIRPLFLFFTRTCLLNSPPFLLVLPFLNKAPNEQSLKNADSSHSDTSPTFASKPTMNQLQLLTQRRRIVPPKGIVQEKPSTTLKPKKKHLLAGLIQGKENIYDNLQDFLDGLLYIR